MLTSLMSPGVCGGEEVLLELVVYYFGSNLWSERPLEPLNHYQVSTILREEHTSDINKEVLTSFNKRHISVHNACCSIFRLARYKTKEVLTHPFSTYYQFLDFLLKNYRVFS